MMRRALGFLLKAWGAVSLLALALGAGLMLTAGYWLRADDAPGKADAIVLLAGDPRRAAHAANLYLRGLAPAIYTGRPRVESREPLCSLGMPCPLEEDVSREAMIRCGVPEADIVLYGRDLMSTVDEAENLARALPPQAKTVLVVTSPYHSRRAKIILSRTLPGREVVMCTVPYERLEPKWWTDQPSARAVIVEVAKFAFYYLGRPFRSPLSSGG